MPICSETELIKGAEDKEIRFYSIIDWLRGRLCASSSVPTVACEQVP